MKKLNKLRETKSANFKGRRNIKTGGTFERGIRSLAPAYPLG